MSSAAAVGRSGWRNLPEQGHLNIRRERSARGHGYYTEHPVETVACPDCDLLQQLPDLPPGGRARCPRCGHVLATRPADPLDRPLALTVAAAIVFIIANTAPLMGLSAVGRHASTTIIGGAYEMWVQDEKITAVIVAFCAVIAPAGYILFMLTVLLAVRRPPAPRWVGEMLRGTHTMRRWSMNEVMLLGILVALIKIAELATVKPGIGMYAMGTLVVLFAAIMMAVDLREIWNRVTWEADVPAGSGTGHPPLAEARR
jgi:paraquat-inducible protein A